MTTEKNKRFLHCVRLATAAVAGLILVVFRWGGSNGTDWQSIIPQHGDRLGYYIWLPAVFIDQNLGNQDTTLEFIHSGPNGTLNKYAVGTAVLQLPFFLTALAVAHLTGYPPDGFSLPFQLLISLSSLFYLFAGLYFVDRSLRYYRLSAVTRAIVTLLLALGTNLLFYSTISGSMSHVYSFAVISGFIFTTLNWSKTLKTKYLAISAVLLGAIVLIRPTNVVIALLVPFLFEDNKSMWQALKKVKLPAWLAAFFLFTLISGIQPLMWKLQTGNWIEWSYRGEGFYWTKPAVFQTLLSFRRGLLIYTPVWLVALWGLPLLLKRAPRLFVGWCLVVVTTTYIISAWWNWYYGDGFGHRAFIEYYPVLVLPLAFLIEASKGLKKKILLTIIALFALLNLLQSYQYYARIMHPYDMNREKYAFIFLKTGTQYREALGGNRDIMPFSRKKPDMLLSTTNHFEGMLSNWGETPTTCSNPATGCYAVLEKIEWGPTFSIPAGEWSQKGDIFAVCSLKRYEPETNSSSEALIALDVQDSSGSSRYHYTFKLNDTPAKSCCKWRTYEYSFVIPEFQHPNDRILIFVWNIGKQTFCIDDFNIEFYLPKP